MVKLLEPDTREIITRAPFVEEGVGEMVAHILHGDAHIDVEIKPFETEMYASFDLLPKKARRLAADLVHIADVAQQAMWTPKLLANVGRGTCPARPSADHRAIAAVGRTRRRARTAPIRLAVPRMATLSPLKRTAS